MQDEEIENRPPGDDADPPPADPSTQDPPLPTEPVLLDQDEADPSRTGPEEEEPDYEIVLNNSERRRIKKGKMNKITLTGP